ncbi:MAG: aminopeptidase P family protein, partial [bacterium]
GVPPMASDPAWKAIYQARRTALRARVPDGAILLMGESLQPHVYPQSTYPFRQNSHVLYYSGLNEAEIALLLLPGGDEVLCMDAPTDDDLVWTGPLPPPERWVDDAGLTRTIARRDLPALLRDLAASRVPIRYIAGITPSQREQLAQALGVGAADVNAGASALLRDAIINQRNIKAVEELLELETAVDVTAQMHAAAREVCVPGASELAVAARIQSVALDYGRSLAYFPIVSTHGEILHNNGYTNPLNAGDILLIDAAAESPRHYASDITRTLAVDGTFTGQQQAIYDIVLKAQLTALAAMKPGVPYREVHDISARVVAAGLIDLGLMQGDPHEAVVAGAHACFYPHGLGHFLGMDVHDMEDLGEDHVGYGPGQTRSTQFGTAYIRCVRPLEAGFVVTVEPGIYFNPFLIDQWQAAGLHREFIRYDKLDASWRDLRGIRIEDDVVVTETGARVLGPGIPK